MWVVCTILGRNCIGTPFYKEFYCESDARRYREWLSREYDYDIDCIECYFDDYL